MKKINAKNLNKGFIVFTSVYAILSILYSFYNLTVVRNSLFAHNSDSLDIQTYQVYSRLAGELEKYSSLLIYAIIITVGYLLFRFFIDYYKKLGRKKIEINDKVKKQFVIVTVIYILVFLFCGVLQNIMFDTVVADELKDFSNFWEFPTNFLIPVIMCYVYNMCILITKE